MISLLTIHKPKTMYFKLIFLVIMTTINQIQNHVCYITSVGMSQDILINTLSVTIVKLQYKVKQRNYKII